MATNLQTFSGEVEIPEGNLQLKRILELSTNNASTSNTGILFSRNLGSTSNSNVIVYFDEATDSLRFGHTLNASSDSEIIMDSANVLNMNVFGDIEASYFKGDGGLLSNLVTDLQSVTENGAETDQTLVLTNAVTGIDVQTGNVNVAGNVTASIFFGDGGLLSNITQTLQWITEIGNTTSIALEFNNVTTGFVTTSNVGIVNTSPQHNFSVGSNLYVHDTASNVLTVEGNVSAHRLTLGAIEITPAYGLENVTNISNLAYDTLLFQNASTAFVTTAMAGIGLQPDSSDVGTSGLHVDGHLRLGGQADNTDNELMYIKSAGALGVLANESDTNNTNTELRLQSGDTNNSNITMVGKSSAQYMTFGTNAAERMRINSSGNVGIGTNSPAYKLDVRGTASHAGSELMARWNSQNETVFPQDITAQYHKIATLGTTGDGSNGGKLRISGTIGGFGESSTTLIDAFVSTRGGPSYGGTLHGYGGGDDPIDKVDILVYKEADDTFAVWIKLVRFFTFDFTVTGGTITGASRTLVLLPCPVTDTSVATPTGTLEGSVVSACSIVFTADGNVGIGTTSPSGFELYNKEMNQTFRADGSNIHKNNKSYIDSRDTSAPNTLTQRYAVSAANDSGGSAEFSELVIGATADENSAVPGSSFISFSDNRKLYLGSHPVEDFMSDWSTVSNQAYPRMGSNTFAPHVTLLPSGNFGIGTTSPGYNLDVDGTVNTGALTATSGAFSGALNINGGPEDDTTPALTIGGGLYTASDLYV